MPKFYISSGDFKQVVDRPDSKTAVYDAFQSLKGDSPMRLGIIVVVSERGFDSIVDDDMIFSTLDVLEDTGQIENFKLEDWL